MSALSFATSVPAIPIARPMDACTHEEMLINESNPRNSLNQGNMMYGTMMHHV